MSQVFPSRVPGSCSQWLFALCISFVSPMAADAGGPLQNLFGGRCNPPPSCCPPPTYCPQPVCSPQPLCAPPSCSVPQACPVAYSTPAVSCCPTPEAPTIVNVQPACGTIIGGYNPTSGYGSALTTYRPGWCETPCLCGESGEGDCDAQYRSDLACCDDTHPARAYPIDNATCKKAAHAKYAICRNPRQSVESSNPKRILTFCNSPNYGCPMYDYGCIYSRQYQCWIEALCSNCNLSQQQCDNGTATQECLNYCCPVAP